MPAKKLDESLQKELSDRFVQMTTDSGWLEYLDKEFWLCQRNYGRKYSVNNAFLIDLQFPGATIVGGFWDLKNMGYTVNEPSRIQIFGPGRQRSYITTEEVEGEEREVSKKFMYYPVAKVFDISQTKEYKEMEPPSHSERFFTSDVILDGVPSWIANYSEEWTTDFSSTVSSEGEFDIENKRVVFSSKGSAEERALSMVNLWSLFYMNWTSSPEEYQDSLLVRNLEARSAAYVLGSMIEGFRPDPGGIRFIARNLEDPDEDAKEMSRRVHRVVSNTADFLLS